MLVHLSVKRLRDISWSGGKLFGPRFEETRIGPNSNRSLGIASMPVASDDHARYPRWRPCRTSGTPAPSASSNAARPDPSAKGSRVE